MVAAGHAQLTIEQVIEQVGASSASIYTTWMAAGTFPCPSHAVEGLGKTEGALAGSGRRRLAAQASKETAREVLAWSWYFWWRGLRIFAANDIRIISQMSYRALNVTVVFGQVRL